MGVGEEGVVKLVLVHVLLREENLAPWLGEDPDDDGVSVEDAEDEEDKGDDKEQEAGDKDWEKGQSVAEVLLLQVEQAPGS